MTSITSISAFHALKTIKKSKVIDENNNFSETDPKQSKKFDSFWNFKAKTIERFQNFLPKDFQSKAATSTNKNEDF